MKPILILGLFQNIHKANANILTAEDRIAAMFLKNNIPVITSSHLSGRFERLFDSVITIIKRRKEYDIAIVPLFGTWPSFLWQEVVTRLLKLFKKKIIIGIHGGSIPERVDAGALRFLTALGRADMIVSPSAFMQHYFSAKGYNVRIIQNPINIDSYDFVEKESMRPHIIWMRAFSDVYNPDMAVRVAIKMAARYATFRMVMAGKDGPLKKSIVDKVKEAGLETSIEFPGYINLAQKKNLAITYDIYISTNSVDNAPVSLIEFMSMGVPVVTTNAGGISYLVQDKVTGLLVDNNDDEAMFQKLCTLIEHSTTAKEIAHAARKYAEEFDEKNVVLKWQQVLQELTNN